MKRIVLILSFIITCAACKKNVPPPETVPAPKAQAEELPTSSVPAGGAILSAPGNYIVNTVGQIDKAKAAKELFEKTSKEQMKSLDFNDTGGN